MARRELPPPTDEQTAILDAARTTESSMVIAFAGCAKSTTLEMASYVTKVPALALAFNKAITDELKGRLGPAFTVKSMNGYGLGAWLKAHPDISLVMDDKKVGKLVSKFAKSRKIDLESDQWTWVRQLVSRAQLAGISPHDIGSPLTPDTPEEWEILAEELWVPPDEKGMICDLARDVLIESISLARQGLMTFDDQIYCPTILGGIWPRFSRIAVDEAQDLNRLNHRMIELSMRPETSLMMVGDPKQAIYQFRGADSDSMGRLGALRPQWRQLPLATTFRCPKVIVSRQQSHAPGFRAWHTNAEGVFSQLKARDEVDELGGWNYASLAEHLPHSNASMAILCRNNAPLLSLAFKLIRAGVGPTMLGRDIGKGLIALSKKILPDDSTPRDIMIGQIIEWRETETSAALAADNDEKVASINDKAGCLLAVLESARAKDARQLRDLLTSLFSREGGQVALGTIHRSKGLEWDVVLHLDPWRIPSKYARELAKAGNPTQLGQEMNLRYVCETRTKFVLLNGDLEDFNES